jgi:hypothetical protein
MIQGILIGMGAGYAIYSLVSWVAENFIFAKKPDHAEADERNSGNKPALPYTEVVLEREASLGEVSRSEALVEEKGAGASSLEAVATVEPSAEEVMNLLESQTSGEGPDEKRWFLVRSTKGYLRATLLRAKTPKAVAGPFPTKTAALRAKELYDTGNSGVINLAPH